MGLDVESTGLGDGIFVPTSHVGPVVVDPQEDGDLGGFGGEVRRPDAQGEFANEPDLPAGRQPAPGTGPGPHCSTSTPRPRSRRGSPPSTEATSAWSAGS